MNIYFSKISRGLIYIFALILFLFFSFIYWAYEEDRDIFFIKEYVENRMNRVLSSSYFQVGDIKFRITRHFKLQFVMKALQTYDIEKKINIKIPRVEMETNIFGTLLYGAYKVNNINIVNPTIHIKNAEQKTNEISDFNFANIYENLLEKTQSSIQDIENIVSIMKNVEDKINFKSCKIYIENELGIKKIDVKIISVAGVKNGISSEMTGTYNNEDFNIFAQFISNKEKQIYAKLSNINLDMIAINTPLDKEINNGTFNGTIQVYIDSNNSITGLHLGIRNLFYPYYNPEINNYNKLSLYNSAIQIKNNLLFIEDFNARIDDIRIKGNLYSNLINNDSTFKSHISNIDAEYLYYNWNNLFEKFNIHQNIQNTLIKGNISTCDVSLDYNENSIKNLTINGSVRSAKVNLQDEYGFINDIDGQFSFDGTKINFILSGGNYEGIDLQKGALEFKIANKTLAANIGVAGNIRDFCNVAKCSDFTWLSHDTLNGYADGVIGVIYNSSENKPNITIKGKLSGVEALVYNNLVVNNGNFDVLFYDNNIEIGGNALINNRNSIVSFVKNSSLNKSKFKIRGEFDINDIIDSGLIPRTEEMKVSGDIDLNVDVISEKKDIYGEITTINGTASINDIYVNIPRTNWHGQDSGIIKFSIQKNSINDINVKKIVWNGENIKLEGEGSISDNKTSVLIHNLMFLKNDCSIEYLEEYNQHYLKIKGKSLDLRNIKKLFSKAIKDGQTSYDSINIDLAIDNIFMDSGVKLRDSIMNLNMDTNSINKFYLDAKGEGNVYLQGGIEGEEVYLIANNAGVVSDGLDLTNSINKGYLTAFFDRKKDINGKLFGHVVIRNFEMRNVPALVKILTLATIPAADITNLLGGQGISFYRMRITLEYDGNNLIIKEGIAESHPLGIKFRGPIKMDNGYFDIKGVVIPAYMLNKLVSKIPIIGGLITGDDEEGLIAVNYTAKGINDNYDVTVDTLSLIAPGIFRKILGALYDENKKKHQ